ncbi:hypothetical protein Tco_1328331 [Tanacetum coccineum]
MFLRRDLHVLPGRSHFSDNREYTSFLLPEPWEDVFVSYGNFPSEHLVALRAFFGSQFNSFTSYPNEDTRALQGRFRWELSSYVACLHTPELFYVDLLCHDGFLAKKRSTVILTARGGPAIGLRCESKYWLYVSRVAICRGVTRDSARITFLAELRSSCSLRPCAASVGPLLGPPECWAWASCLLYGPGSRPGGYYTSSVSIQVYEVQCIRNVPNDYLGRKQFVEDKENYLEHPIPAAPVATPRQQVPPQALAAHAAWVKGSKEIASLMLMTIDLDIQRNLTHLGAYDMLQELKTMFAQQA